MRPGDGHGGYVGSKGEHRRDGSREFVAKGKIGGKVYQVGGEVFQVGGEEYLVGGKVNAVVHVKGSQSELDEKDDSLLRSGEVERKAVFYLSPAVVKQSHDCFLVVTEQG
ncbi:hypothetical protein BGZ58_001799 [Dissophora ornata]|nr:hypothetical protein BGZ58_001799 [Dissophora ornata]